jgi:hypothetical protein
VRPRRCVGSVRSLITAALLVALSCAPTLAQAAATPSYPSYYGAAGEVSGKKLAQPAQLDVSPGSPQDYAAREAAAPQLAAFSGGGGGIYIGTGALVVALLVVVVVLLVR